MATHACLDVRALRMCVHTSHPCRSPPASGAVVGVSCSASPQQGQRCLGSTAREQAHHTPPPSLSSPHLSWCKQRHTPDTHTHTDTHQLWPQGPCVWFSLKELLCCIYYLRRNTSPTVALLCCVTPAAVTRDVVDTAWTSPEGGGGG